MIIHRYSDGSENYEYEVGDLVIVEHTIGGGWFDYGPTRAEKCIVTHIYPFKNGTFRTAELYIRYSDDWGPARCFPWMVKPHPETLAATPATLILKEQP